MSSPRQSRYITIPPRGSFYLCPEADQLVACERGGLHVVQSLAWIGPIPLQTEHWLEPGHALQVSGSQLRIHAGAEGAVLRVESPESVLKHLVQTAFAALRSSLPHRAPGAARPHH